MGALAIATNDPASVAETYVRQHMRLVLPGRTVGIALDGDGSGYGGLPFYTRRPRSGGGLIGKATSIGALVRAGYAGALTPTEETEIAAYLKRHGVTALLSEFGTTGITLRNLCKSLGLRHVVNFHGHDATVLPARADIRWAYRLLARDADAFVCGTEHFAGILADLGFPRDKIEIVPCGVELAEFGEDHDGDPMAVLMVGRLTWKKRPDLSVRAFAKAHEALPGLRLDIVGDGPMREACEAAVRDCGVEEAVTLHGALPHDAVKTLFGRAGIFMQHSMTAANGDQESQGISLLEAMTSCLPVVATDHNGFSETVDHGATGLLSPEGDVDAMAENLLRVARDPVLRRAMGAAGRRRAENDFDAQMLAGRLRAILFPAESAKARAS